MKKFILGTIVGAGLGTGTTYILMKKKMEKEIQKEVDEFKKDWEKDHHIQDGSMPSEEYIDSLGENDDMSDTEESDEVPDYEQSNDDKAINYADFYEPDEEVEESEEAAKMVEEIKSNDANDNSIREISFDEYDRNESFTKRALVFYADGTLAAEEDDIVIEDVDRVIGEENLKAFEESSDEEIYFMNLSSKMCYEITKSDYTYKEFTGYSPEDATIEFSNK